MPIGPSLIQYFKYNPFLRLRGHDRRRKIGCELVERPCWRQTRDSPFRLETGIQEWAPALASKDTKQPNINIGKGYKRKIGVMHITVGPTTLVLGCIAKCDIPQMEYCTHHDIHDTTAVVSGQS